MIRASPTIINRIILSTPVKTIASKRKMGSRKGNEILYLKIVSDSSLKIFLILSHLSIQTCDVFKLFRLCFLLFANMIRPLLVYYLSVNHYFETVTDQIMESILANFRGGL